MGTRNTPEQQRRYNRALRARKAAEGLRTVRADLTDTELQAVADSATKHKETQSAAVRRLILAGLAAEGD